MAKIAKSTILKMTNVEEVIKMYQGVDFQKFLEVERKRKEKENRKKRLQEIKRQNEIIARKKRIQKIKLEKKLKDKERRKNPIQAGKTAKKMELKKFIQMSKVYAWYTTKTLEDRKKILVQRIKKYHPNENLIDENEMYIYPRGIDYVQCVLTFTHERIQYLNLNNAAKKIKEYEQMDLAWTLWWSEYFVKTKVMNEQNEFKITKDGEGIFLKDFLKMCGKRRNKFYELENENGKRYGTKIKNKLWLSEDECKEILKKDWTRPYIQILSERISATEKDLKKEFGFIKYTKQKKIRNQKTDDTEDEYSLEEVIGIQNQNEIQKVKKYIFKNHPLQSEIKYDAKIKKYIFTEEGCNWYFQIYSMHDSISERIKNEIKINEEKIETILKNKKSIPNLNDDCLKKWNLTESEFRNYKMLAQLKLNKENLTDDEIEDLFSELKLRRIIWTINILNKKETSYIRNCKSRYTTLNELTFFGNYEGDIINYKFKKNQNSILELYIETEYDAELEKIKLEIDVNRFTDKKIFLSLIRKNTHIQFNVNGENGHNKIEKFKINYFVEYELDDTNEMYHLVL